MVRKILNYDLHDIRPFYEDLDDLIDCGLDEYFDDDTGEYVDGPWDNFDTISSKIVRADLECSSYTREYIFRDRSTGDYYKGECTYFYEDDSEYDQELIQVFPKEVSIIIYE